MPAAKTPYSTADQNGLSPSLSIINEQPLHLEGPSLLHELVSRPHHDATAIDFLEHGSKRRKFSYKTLHSLSGAFAGRITQILAELESASSIIPVLLPQSPELYVVLLAILKAGKAFCPLNLDTPPERLRFILDDISADLLITSSSYNADVRTATNIHVVLIDHELSRDNDSVVDDLPQPNTSDLAYVLYTSGSTGLPKAVSVSHRAVTQSLLAHDRHIPEFSRFLQFAAPTFDVSIFEIFFPWFRGKTLVGCTRTQMLNDLPGTIVSLDVDAAELTPTVVGNLLPRRSSVPCLRLLLTIGEMLTRPVVDEYGGDASKPSLLWAMYGPTEAAIHCTIWPQFSTSDSTSTIGIPLDTVSAFIITPSTQNLTPLPIEILPLGEIGELAIGGPQIADEYLHRPDLTHSSFIEHPHYGRLYRTGDRAKINEKGTLECLGRVVTGQVKLRGQRIELGEVEQAIMKTKCRAATAMIIQENLVAFCTVEDGVLYADVLATCKRWLPGSMLPSDIVLVDAMPQLPSGKVDRNSLQKMYLRSRTDAATSSFNVSVEDPISRSVWNIISHHTLQKMELHTKLASSGIDSLKAIRIASALRREGYSLGAIDVLSASTLADLIEACRERKMGDEETLAESLTDTRKPQLNGWHDDVVCIIPCTPLQEAMLAETRSRPTAYCNWIEVEFSVAYTYEQIRDAILLLAQETELLRTGFCTESRHTTAFSQIIWKELLPSQIHRVSKFSREYLLQSDNDFLRPFNIQISTQLQRPRLLFQIHHALYDGWSFDLLLHDLDKCLRGERVLTRPSFREVVQYFTNERKPNNDQISRNYWKTLLSDHIPMTLPNYHGKIIHTSAAHRVSGKSTVSARKLFDCARQLAVNPQVYFQAATAYMLGLYSGSSDVVLGNVTSGRTIPVVGVEDVIGPCIASLPFRLDFADTPSVHDILQKTQSINRSSLRYSELPLREIARSVNTKPGMRLFETLFVWQQTITSDSNASITAKIVDSADELEFRITLEFEPVGDHILFRSTFDASTVSERQIEHLFRQIDEVVEFFLDSANHCVTEINRNFTTPSLSIANPTPLEQRFHHGPSYAVEQWALRDPQRIAVVFGHNVNGIMEVKEKATYSLLNSRANQLARVLAKHGVGSDQLVCIMMEKSVDLYTSILAVLKLGCGYLPLVPDTPVDRVKTILTDARVAVCISESPVSFKLRSDLSVDIIDFDLTILSGHSKENLNIPYNGEHLAYAIFTSGSTGTPKGVLVTQDNLMSNLQYLSTVYPFSADSCLLQACSQAFDVSVFEIFFSWYVGMRLCSATKEDLFYDFEAAIDRLEVTHLSLTPTVAALVDPEKVPKVEFLVTAGEALTEHVRRKWAGRGLYQGYGPSETTNICTVRPAVTLDDLINNIGQPFSNTSAFVLDPDSQEILPRGAIGELCFGGSQVFRGYLNRPELNAQKIIRHPKYGRIYRSGDMGILIPDDSILSTGRTDDQVKIRGQRVELGETTAAILDHEAVRDCVTLALDQNNQTKTLVSFWVPAAWSSANFEILEPSQFAPTIAELFNLLSRRLSSYMIPSHIMPISCLPMTPQAKIDKRLLQRHFSRSGDAKLNHSTISNGIKETDEGDLSTQWEKSVAKILFRTLDISPHVLKRTTSFFNLGLDSVSAIRFCSELRKMELGEFSISEVLKHPSVADLVSLKKLQPRTRTLGNSPSVDPSGVFTADQIRQIRSHIRKDGPSVMKILPCTPLQEAMISSGLSSSEQAYCNVMVFDVTGDDHQLRNCWEAMVQRHEILRTAFVATEDPSYSFAQVILKDHHVIWHQQRMDDGLQPRISKIILGLMKASKPPVYFGLVQGEDSTKLLFCCHHALYDGIAISTLLAEIQESYRGHQLPPPIPYEVYLKHMLDQNLVEADKYWSALLEGFEPTSFPALTTKTHTHEGFATSSRYLSVPLEAVKQASRELSVSLLSVVQAAWVKLLHFYTHESDVCFGNVVSGRSFPGDDLDRLVAPCFNTLPVRAKFDFNKSNRALVNLMHSRSIESHSHQLTPLRRIQRTTLKEGGRLFDTVLILQQPSSPLDNSIWKLEQDLGDMDIPIVCEFVQDQAENTLRLTLHYLTSLLSESEASVVMDTCGASLYSIVTSPDVPSIDTDMFPTNLRATSNMNFKRFDSRARFLHSGFERMASLHPERIALDFLHGPEKKTTWSFEQLNGEANKIAHGLIGLGTGPEEVVPIHIAKSPVYYASILGVLKAGAAFAPVHPDLPEARRQFMFAELKPRVVLCDDSALVSKDLTGAAVLNVQELPGHSKLNPVVDLKETNLAYCLFTSGSTGTPKAVSMEHNAPIQTIESSRALVPWGSSSRLLQYAAVTFDMCYYDCFLAWTFGFTLCAAEQGNLLNDLPGAINALEADLLDLTPSVAESLKKADVPNVKWLYCIGEAMSPAVVKEWQGACVNSYGPTEAAFCTTMIPVSRQGNTSVIGKPFPTTSFAVFSEQGETPLPLLSIGELYIGGTQLARGYWDKPDLTNERFVTRCGQRFYKSGDMVRMLSDGNFEFLGRMDDQVKIRGLRVELGEINSVLADLHPDLASVTTQILRKDQAAKEQLVSFLVMRQPVEQDDVPELQQHLKKLAGTRLPSYMVPQFFLVVDKIPKSMAGKIDKKALGTIFQQHSDASTLTNGVLHDTEHRWSRIESDIRKVLAQISKTPTDSISPTTSIYQLGLDSISAVQIASVLRNQGYAVKATDILRYTTCSELAERLSRTPTSEIPSIPQLNFHTFESQHRPQILKYHNLQNKDVLTIRPCTPLQDGMISQFLAKDGAVYMNYLRLQLDTNVDIGKLEAAWSAVMKHHTMLRTGFTHVKDLLSSFAMIEYTQDSAILPWSVAQDETELSVNAWLAHVEHRALKELHVPPWALRFIQRDGQLLLDLAIFHALFDAQSLHHIFSDVMASYQGLNMPPALSSDEAVNHIIQSSKQENRLGDQFWTELGKSANSSRFPNLTPLKHDPEPAMVCKIQSAKSLLELENGCRRVNTTVPAVGMASWLSLLSSYTGESSVTCGIVLSGRNSDVTAHVNFPCINTVPLAFTVTDDMPNMLKSITNLNAGIQEHQFTPLKRIQGLMGFPNETLFDTLFAYQKLSDDTDSRGLWTVIHEKATIEYPVSIEMEPKEGQLEYRLTYLPHMIPRQQASLILAQLDHLMESFIFGSETAVADSNHSENLYSITPAKEDELRSDAGLLHELVERTTERFPQHVAFEFVSKDSNGKRSARRWTYAELDREGNKIAQLLFSLQVEPGNLVGVCFDKCPEASFAMLGILKAGCAFVAIDPGAPAARQTFIVDDSRAQAVLSMSSQSAQFEKDTKVPVLNLDEVDWRSFSGEKLLQNSAISPQDRSYCLYTSGTTGTPKGCEITHENAVQALLAFQRLFAGHWDASSRWLQFASFHFDVSVLEQYWSWSVGICVVSAPRDLIFEDLASSIHDLDITHIDLTPSLAQILHPDDVPSLCKGVFITGGESLKQEILDVWGPKGVIYNGYGPTEATIGCTMYPRVPANGKPSNIGPQFDNVGSLVLRPGSDIPVLRGGIGELCVSGKLVGKGYLNRPELTAERFPCLDRFSRRVYRTGDMVRILHDDTFEFLGRADDQVKLRGQRLEVTEINSVIKQSNQDISDVATLVLKHPKQQKEQLVAFLVYGKGLRAQPEVLLDENQGLASAKQACHDKLPPYMIPTHFVPLTSMPLNVNNKADGKRLKQIYEELSANDLQKLSANSNARDEPLSKEEEKIRDAMLEALDINRESTTKDSSFFELGMDSISVIGVTRTLKNAGFAKVTASMIMQHPTIRRLAKALAVNSAIHDNHGSVFAAQQYVNAVSHRHRRKVDQSLSIESNQIEAIAPCTPLQQGMIARSMESDNGLYFNSFQFRLKMEVDEQKLDDAWKTVYDWAQVLRTVFINTEEGHLQAVLRDIPFTGIIRSSAQEQNLIENLNRLRQHWLSLNEVEFNCPFQVHLVTTQERKLLVVHIFHGLYDGNSIGLLMQAVWESYQGKNLLSNTPSFQTALVHGPLRAADGAREFWKKRILTNTTPLPKLHDNPEQDTVVVTRTIFAPTNFDHIRRQLNTTAQAIVQACWLSVLHKHVKGNMATGIVVSGRSIDLGGADRIVGPMFNTIPYHHRAQHRESWSSMIRTVHDFNVSAHPFQHTPLRDIMKWCKRSHGNPLFDNLFVYQVAQDNQEWARNDAWEILDDEAVADYPLAFEVEQRNGNELKVMLVAQGDIADAQTAAELVDQFEEALSQALHDPSAVLELPVNPHEAAENPFTIQSTSIHEKNGTSDFEWTNDAVTIKEEIVNLVANATEDIDETTSIFELGLDSIDAIKLSSRLKRRGVELSVSGIVRGLTISKMVQNVSIKNSQAEDSSPEFDFGAYKQKLARIVERQAFDTDSIEDVLPLTPLQEAMVAEMIASDYTRYYNHDVLELEPRTDISKLKEVWRAVVLASPILRTGFMEVEDPDVACSFVQVIHNRPHKFYSHITASGPPNFTSIFEGLRNDTLHGLSSIPPFHLTFVDTPSQSYLVLSIAHALYDGWSLSLLHSDVHRAYCDAFETRPSYESMLSAIIKASRPDAAGFWKDYLSGANPSTFSRRRPSQNDTSGVVHRFEEVSEVALGDVQAFARKNNISLQTVGQTVFALVTAFFTHSLDITFGSVLSGRDDEEASQLMFPTMNTVAIRAILHGTSVEMLHYVQDNFANIKQWQHYPLRKALSQADISGKLFESLFIFQKSLEQDRNKDERLYTSIEGHNDVEYPVCVEMEVVKGMLFWRCAVKGEVFNAEETKQLLKRMDDVLQRLMNRPETPIIEVNAEGTSICGLPAFKEVEMEVTGHAAESNTDDKKDTPDTATTSKIREMLSAVSKIPEEEMTNDMTIFHMGLDSISAIKVSSLLRKHGIMLSVSEMLQAGSVEKMASLVDSRTAEPSNSDKDSQHDIEEAIKDLDKAEVLRRAGIDIDNVVQVLPATAGQLYMLSMWLNTNGANFYPSFVYNLDGDITFEELQESWRALVTANPILQTCFASAGEHRVSYIQALLRETDTTLTDVTGCGEEQIENCIRQAAPYQPWAKMFVSQHPGGWTLRLKIHHALYDGVSLPLLMQQLQDLCNGATPIQPQEGILAKLVATAYSPSALQQRRQFWGSYLGRSPTTPTHSSPTSPPSARIEIFRQGLTPSQNLDTKAREHGISPHALFLAAYAKLTTQASPSIADSLILGIYLANRSLPYPNIASAPTPTLSLLPLRILSPQARSIMDIATSIQRDIQALSAPEIACSSLVEINCWTGVKVDVFVNFLVDVRETGDDDDDDATAATTSTVAAAVRMKATSIRHVAALESQESRSGVEKLHSQDEIPRDLVNPDVNRVFLHAIDVEATVRDGGLDVGVFAPVEKMSLEEGETLVEGLKRVIEAL